MPFSDIITRGDAAPLIPEQTALDILKVLPESSAALKVCRTQRMSTKTFSQPVLNSFPVAYWVNGDTGIKQTTKVDWSDYTMTAEELATIVVIPDNLIADSGYPLWAEVRPLLVEAIGHALDLAVFEGVNKPATWPSGIVPAAIAAGNVDVGESLPEEGGASTDLLETFELVEDDGFDVTRVVASKKLRGDLRKARDSTGQKLLDVNTSSIEGVPIEYVGFGVFQDPTAAIVGDFSMAVIGIRQDITYKMLDQAVITDDTGKVIINLPQQDSQAMRVTARFGFVVAQPKTHSPEANPYPFAVLQKAPVIP